MNRLSRNSYPHRLFLTIALLLLALSVVPVSVLAQDEPVPEVPEGVPTPNMAHANLSPEIPDPTEPVTVTFASWRGGDVAFQDLKAQFEALHPNITIEFQDAPAEEMRTRLLTQVAANNAPDAAYMDFGTVAEFASRGALLNLDEFIGLSNSVTVEDYVPAFLQATQYEGSVYGLPIDAETTGLFYRTDLFEAAGLDPNDPPDTWEEFRAAAEALTNPDERQYGTIIFAPEAAYYFYPWLWQAGGDNLAEDGMDVIFDSEEGQRAAEFYVGLREFSPPDFLNSNSWDGRVAFAEGTVAMYVAGAWFAGVLQQEFPDIAGLWAMAPLPSDQRCATTIAGDALVVFSQSENPEAAWKWIEFLSAPENMSRLNLGTAEEPFTLLPPRRSLLEDPATFAANPVVEGFAGMMDCAVTSEVVQPRWPEVEQILNEQLARAIYGEIDAATAVQEAAIMGEELLQQ